MITRKCRGRSAIPSLRRIITLEVAKISFWMMVIAAAFVTGWTPPRLSSLHSRGILPNTQQLHKLPPSLSWRQSISSISGKRTKTYASSSSPIEIAATAIENSDSSNDDDATEGPINDGDDNQNTTSPWFRMASNKLAKKIQEIEEKDRSGEQLTQAYCDSVLGLCVASDEWESVLEILEIMKRQGLSQERSSYRACLQACFEAGNGASAKEILIAMEKALVKPEPSDIGLTVAAMCRNSVAESQQKRPQKGGGGAKGVWWRKAVGLLKSSSTTIATKDNVIPVQAYNAVLECMVEEGQWKEAVRLLRLMEQGSSDVTPKEQIKEIGYHPIPEVATYREVIECCVGANQAEQAVHVLYSMKDRKIKPTSYACELVISALSRKLQWRRSVQLLDLMDQMQIPKTVVTYNTVISACARAREVGMAKNLLSRMRKEGIRPDVVSFNSIIGACASTARWKDALAVLDQCSEEPGVVPNIYIYTNAVRACAKGGNTKHALTLFQVVKDKGLPLDAYIYTTVIDACAKARMWKKALSLLDEMQKKGIEPTEVTYSVAISACGNGGQWRKALDLLELMQKKGMPVNLITYNAAITALSKASRQNARKLEGSKRENLTTVEPFDGEDLWSRALLILGQMKNDGIEPDGFCYSSAISCCGAEGRWEEALGLMRAMKRGGPKTRPNKIAYTAAISACGRAGQAEHAIELFQNMKDEGLSADRVAYNALFSALRVAGDADKTFELWGEICGIRSTSTAAIATAKDIASPDIITVTDCIATLSQADYLNEVDQVFREAVQRGIVLRGNSLDSQWETDLTGMSFPVARGAIRYILSGCLDENPENLKDITFITGIGKSHRLRGNIPNSPKSSKSVNSSNNKDPRTSLRDYVREILESDFEPPMESLIPQWAPGTVEVKRSTLIKWLKQQKPKP